MSGLSDTDVKNLLRTLQHDLEQFPQGTNSLEYELESAAKHVPAYLKVVKGHIEQLRQVLTLENHNRRTLESAGLATPVQQLIKLFETLQDDDIQLLEDLAMTASNWQTEASDISTQESVLESAETAT